METVRSHEQLSGQRLLDNAAEIHHELAAAQCPIEKSYGRAQASRAKCPVQFSVSNLAYRFRTHESAGGRAADGGDGYVTVPSVVEAARNAAEPS